MSVVAPPIHNECNASGLRRNFATTLLAARRARPHLTNLRELSTRPYLTTLTELPNRYEARGAWSERLRKHDNSTNLRPMAPRLPSRTTSIREPCLVPARVRFESVPSHISAPQTHLDLVDQSPSTVIQLHALGRTARSTRVRQFTSWTTKISSDRATRKYLKHRHRHTTFPSCTHHTTT